MFRLIRKPNPSTSVTACLKRTPYSGLMNLAACKFVNINKLRDPHGSAPIRRAHLDATAGRGGPKPEIRNPKPETNSNAQGSKAKNRQQCGGFGHSLLGAWGLFRASSFGFRVSAL